MAKRIFIIIFLALFGIFLFRFSYGEYDLDSAYLDLQSLLDRLSRTTFFDEWHNSFADLIFEFMKTVDGWSIKISISSNIFVQLLQRVYNLLIESLTIFVFGIKLVVDFVYNGFRFLYSIWELFSIIVFG